MLRVDEFCPVIVEMCGLRTNYYSDTKNWGISPTLHENEASNASFLLQEEVGVVVFSNSFDFTFIFN